jgi:hypothetical protein
VKPGAVDRWTIRRNSIDPRKPALAVLFDEPANHPKYLGSFGGAAPATLVEPFEKHSASQAAYRDGGRIIGMRLWIGVQSSFGAVVTIGKLRIVSPLAGSSAKDLWQRLNPLRAGNPGRDCVVPVKRTVAVKHFGRRKGGWIRDGVVVAVDGA